MKCPHCGKETKVGKACDNCGGGLAPSQGMEVQYKDFKVSELLDIKVGQHSPAGNRVKKEGSGHKIDRETKNDPASGKQAAGKKRLGLGMTAVIVIIAAIALFFLFKFGIKF